MGGMAELGEDRKRESVKSLLVLHLEPQGEGT